MDLVGNRTLRDVLDERADLSPEKAFLIFEDRDGVERSYTYREFSETVDRLAVGLSNLGIGRNDRVAVHLANSPEILLTWFAVATLGAIMVPSNVANTAAELEYVVSYSQSVAVITQPSLLHTVATAVQHCPDVRHTILARTTEEQSGAVLFESLLQDGVPPRPPVDSEDVVQMLFTSGTTARPKGVLLTHANALRSGERASRAMALDAYDRCLTALPIFHVNAQSVTVLSSLTVGGTCIVLEEYRASKFWSQVRRHKATQTSVVAMQARTLLAQPASPDDTDHSVRRLFYAINISTPEKEEFERRFGVELITATGCPSA